MALEFKVYERTQTAVSNTLGTIEEIAGLDGSIGFVPSNFANSEKRVIVVINKADGTSTQITCSQAVSDGLRAKEISLGQLKSFEVKEQIAQSGEVYNQITMPSAAQPMVKYNLKDIKAESFKVRALSESDLSNLLAISL